MGEEKSPDDYYQWTNEQDVASNRNSSLYSLPLKALNCNCKTKDSIESHSSGSSFDWKYFAEDDMKNYCWQ